MRRWALIAVAVAGVVAVGAWLWPDSGDSSAGEPQSAQETTRATRHKRRRSRPTLPLVVATGILQGRVIRAGAPVAGATVSLRDDGFFLETMTGDDGAFTVEKLPPGRFHVAARKGREASPLYGPVLLGPGQRSDEITLELLAGAWLRGTVLDARTRRAIAHASVRSSAGAVNTDDAGRFELGPLPYDGTWVEASAPGYESRVQWLSLDAARDYSGMELFLRAATMLRGTVTQEGEPVAGASVWAEKGYLTARGEHFGPVSTDEDGHFELGVASGELQLLAAAPGGSRVTGPKLTVAEGGSYDALQIELGQSLSAAGTLTFDGNPAENVALSLIDARSQQPAGLTTSGPGGAFRFQGLAPGSYLVQVTAGSTAAQRGPFEVTGADDAPWNVDISLGAQLRGHVKPSAAGVIVRWRSSDWAGGSVAETVTDNQGAFVFAGVPAGSLTVEAETATAFATTTAKAGDEVTLSLETSGIEGYVLDGEGHAVTDFVVQAIPENGGPPHLKPVLNPQGNFQMPLPPGQYEVHASASGVGETVTPVPVKVDPGMTSPTIRLTLSGTEAFSGMVVDATNDQPLSGVRVRLMRARFGASVQFERYGVFTTDAGGRFEFGGVPPEAWVTFEKDGYLTVSGTVKQLRAIAGGRVRLRPGKSNRRTSPADPYEGVGMQLRPVRSGELFVGGVFDGSPAQMAGVMRDDQILAVDGLSVTGRPVNEVVQRIMGPAGTTVTVKLRRGDRTFDLVLRRRSIQL